MNSRPRACKPIATTTTPPLHCAEGLTGLYSLGACENLNFQNSISWYNWEVVGPVTLALLLIHIELSVLQVSCRKLREDWRIPLVRKISGFTNQSFFLLKSSLQKMLKLSWQSWLWLSYFGKVFTPTALMYLKYRKSCGYRNQSPS